MGSRVIRSANLLVIPYRELDSLRIADDNENKWLRLRSTGSKSCAGSSPRIAMRPVVFAARQAVPVVFPRREFIERRLIRLGKGADHDAHGGKRRGS